MIRPVVIAVLCTVFVLSTQPFLTHGSEAVSAKGKPSSAGKKREMLDLLLSTFLASGDLENALRVTSIATGLFPEDPYWWEKHAELNVWTGNARMALPAYLKAYRLSQRRDIRKKAMELAMALNRFDIAKELLEEEVKTGRIEDIQKMVSVYEQAGSIEELIHMLRGIYEREKDRNVLKTLSRLYFFYGRPLSALKSMDEMEQSFGLTPEDALFKARLLYTLKRYDRALGVLKRYEHRAGPLDTEFWQTMSDIAWGLKDYSASVRASETLYRAKRAREVDYERLFLYWAERDKRRALKYALEGWHNFRMDYMFYYFLNTSASLRDWKLIAREVEKLSTTEFERFMKNPFFVSIYAQTLLNTGRPETARRLYRTLLERAFHREVLAGYIYFLIDVGDHAGLKEVLRRYSKFETEPGLVMPFVLAYMSLQDGKNALSLSKVLPMDTPDRELLYADILSLYGREHRADAVRFRLYRKLKRRLEENPQLVRNRAFMETFVRVALYYEPAGRLKEYLRSAGGVLSADVVEEVEISNLLLRGEHDRARYLIKKYDYVVRPWIHLNLALWEDERMKMLKLLEDHMGTLPVRDTVEALVRTGQIKTAVSHAHHGLALNREDSLLYTQYADLVTEYGQRLKLGAGYIMYGPYEEFKKELSAGLYLARATELVVFGTHAERTNSDSEDLVNPPSSRQETGIRLKKLFNRGRVGLTLGTMKAMEENGFYLVELESRYLKDRISLGLSYGKNLFTEDNVYLYLGGMRQGYTVKLSYSHSHRMWAGLELGNYRYLSQDARELGRGIILRQSLHHRLRRGYPDYTLRLYVEALSFREDRTSGTLIETLYPYSPLRVLNKSYSLVGVGLSFGERRREGYTGVWRPYMVFDVTWNNRTDLGVDAEAGIGGGLFRQDHLSVGLRYVKGFRAGEDIYLGVSVNYRLFY